MGYTLIGTNDPINNPYTVFNLLSINNNTSFPSSSLKCSAIVKPVKATLALAKEITPDKVIFLSALGLLLSK